MLQHGRARGHPAPTYRDSYPRSEALSNNYRSTGFQHYLRSKNMIRACLLGLICIAICAPSANSDDTAGIVKEITGDLAYVSGLNGAASLGSQLQMDNGSTLQVIKKLDDDVLVARVVEENGSSIKVADRISRCHHTDFWRCAPCCLRHPRR